MHTNALKPLLLIISLLLTQIAISRWAWWIIIHVSSGSDRQHLVSESRGPSNDHYQVSWNTNTRCKCENTTNKNTATDTFSATASEESWPERYIWWTRPQKINGRMLTGSIAGNWSSMSPHIWNIRQQPPTEGKTVSRVYV